MSENIVSRADLVSAIAAKTQQPINNVETVVKEYEAAIAEHLEANQEVRLPNFGTFKMSERPARTARNIQTGEPLEVAARSVVKFALGKRLKEIGKSPK